MANIKLDSFNPALYVNHIPEIKIAANKKSMNLILGVIAAATLGLVLYEVYELYKEERER